MLGRRFALTAQRMSQCSRHSFAKMAVMPMPVRTFSSFETIAAASQKLQKALDSEIKYENENYAQLEDIETFLSESGFTFTEQENGLNMTLKKDVGDKLVEVQFEAR